MGEPRSSLVRRWLGIGSVVLGLAFIGGAQWRATDLTNQIDREADLRVAQQCVSSHQRLDQIREAVEFAYRANANTLLSLATSESDPARLQRYRELVEGDVQEIRKTVGDPDCDLAEARRLLGTESPDR